MYLLLQVLFFIFWKFDIENPIIRINTVFKDYSITKKLTILPRIYHD